MNFINVLLLLLILMIVAGVWYWVSWYNDKVWGPRKKSAMMKKGPLAELAQWGFKPTDKAFAGELIGGAAAVPTAFVGTVRGYAVEASFGWNAEAYLMVRVFFEPVSRDYDAIMHAWQAQRAVVKQWEFSRGLFNSTVVFCAPVYIDATLPYSNVVPAPKTDKLMQLAEQIVSGLQEMYVAPLDYGAACELANNVLQESKRRTEVRELKR